MILKTKFPVKTRDIYKIEKKEFYWHSIFGYENKEKFPIYISIKCCDEKHVDLLLIRDKGKRYYILIKDFNTFMYDHALHHGRKRICSHCLQAFSSDEILECHIKDFYYHVLCYNVLIMSRKHFGVNPQ